MPSIRYGPFHALIQHFASSPRGSWFLSHILHALDRFAVKLSGGRATLTGILAGVPVVMLTSTGARSGLERTTPLLPIRDAADPARFAVVASNWGQQHYPAWYFNLKKNPRATCLIDGQAAAYVAHEASGEEYERYWQYAMELYLGYAMYKSRAGRRIPIMVMERS